MSCFIMINRNGGVYVRYTTPTPASMDGGRRFLYQIQSEQWSQPLSKSVKTCDFQECLKTMAEGRKRNWF